MSLPTGWKQTSLKNVATWGSGGTPSRKNANYYGGDVPWIKTGDLGPKYLLNSSEFITGLGVKNSSAKYFSAGSVAIAMYGATIGKTSILGLDATTNQACGVGSPINGITTSNFLYYFLTNEKESFIAKGKGGAQPNISQTLIKDHEINLPPLAEQKVIAEKLDSLLAQVETTKACLDRIPDVLKRFRQSVLAAAVSGRLTEKWREEHSELQVDSGAIQRQVAQYFVKHTKNPKTIRKHGDFHGDITLPISWTWFRAEELCDLITKGTTPKKVHMSSTGDIPYIKVYNLTFTGHLDFSIDPTFIPLEVHQKELRRSIVFPGDVLMNIVGPPLGKVSIVPDLFEEWNINQAISIFRPIAGISNNYLSLCLRDSKLLEATKAKAKATAGQFNLTLEICRDFSVPVPPVEEQTEIVRRVEELFAFADAVEQKAQAATERVNKLTQSILAKAFRGDLTKDWRAANPDLISGENSAEALLEKIKAEREAMKPKKKTRAKKVKA